MTCHSNAWKIDPSFLKSFVWRCRTHLGNTGTRNTNTEISITSVLVKEWFSRKLLSGFSSPKFVEPDQYIGIREVNAISPLQNSDEYWPDFFLSLDPGLCRISGTSFDLQLLSIYNLIGTTGEGKISNCSPLLYKNRMSRWCILTK